MSRQIELTWVCSSCSHRNLGRFTRCQRCDNPMDASEHYDMPSDTTAAPTVTEEALLRMATAGPNWRCAYCGSDQRKLDGSCGECGASVEKGKPVFDALPGLDIPAPILTPWREYFHWGIQQKIAVVVVAVLAVAIPVYLWMNRERTYEATVSDVQWTHTIAVERYTIWDRTGWRNELPADAFEVVSKGQAVHHYDTVPDGTTTESYTESVRCGEDCTESAQSCHEVCTNSRNGFASCNTECSGGGRSCSPRYCMEQRTRQVPRFRQEPRYAESVAYKIWDWDTQRKVEATGTGTDIASMGWPTDQAHIGEGLKDREQERERRSERYDVTIAYDESSHVKFAVNPSFLSKFAISTRHEVRVKDSRVTIDGQVMESATLTK